MSDAIEIENLRLRCMIGFSPHELKDKQDVVINLRIQTDLYTAGRTDNPEDALDYRTISKAIIQHVESTHYQLVEALAESIARIVIEHGADAVQVRVHKPHALRFADSVGVVIQRTGADYA